MAKHYAMARTARSSGSQRGRRGRPAWAALPDDELLELRLKDLKLGLAGTWLDECLRALNGELAARGLGVRAHGWISDEWFSPQDTYGIAFPFWLAHPRLMKLERKMMHEVEGGTRQQCMRLLRHEAGHVVQHAYGVHRRRRWRSLFGRASLPYPDHYQANPVSKDYVQHLPRWYAQCHPDEDFAETFAVWLAPRSTWRRRYADWPALKKLEYVDELAAELAHEKPLPHKRIEVDPLGKLPGTLREHYEKKRERYAIDTPTVFDRDLRRIFSTAPHHRGAPRAASVLRRHRAEILRLASRWNGAYPVALDAALDDIIGRTRALDLRAPAAPRKLKSDITAMLTSTAVHAHYSASRRRWFAV
jgi:hypothetical protein